MIRLPARDDGFPIRVVPLRRSRRCLADDRCSHFFPWLSVLSADNMHSFCRSIFRDNERQMSRKKAARLVRSDVTGATEMPWKSPAMLMRPRLKIRTIMVLMVLVAIGLGIWHEYWSPRRIWRRAIHAPKIERIEFTSMFGHPYHPPRHVFERSIPWPIKELRIRGLDEAESSEELELAMADPDASIRQELYMLVANATASMTRPVAIRLLAPGLGERDEISRMTAVRGLGPFILPTDPIAPRFFGMLDDRSPLVRQNAVDSIAAVIARAPDCDSPGRDQLTAAVLARLGDPEPRVRGRD